jgi:N-acyl-D-amino-acid deacylase
MSHALRHTAFATFFLAANLIASLSTAAQKADILLQGGTIIDGTGGEPINGDVAIADGKIIVVGQATDMAADETVDCTGLVIAPGFIDLHNHSDDSILKEKNRSALCYLQQGCTTLVTGNCGGGRGDVGKYYDDVDEAHVGINIAQLVPQGEVRDTVMGKVRRAPTPDELKKMQDLADKGMQEGAWGMSTGLQYVPGSFAKTDELIAMAEVVGKRGGIYASHVRDEGDELIESVQEVIDIGRGGHLPCHVSHFKASKKPNWGKVHAAAHLIEQAQNDGLKITADQYPYTASSTSIMAMLLPDDEREGGEGEAAKRLKDPEQGKRLREIMAKGIESRGEIMIANSKKKSAWVGKTISQIAKDEGREQVDVAIELLTEEPGTSGVNFGMDEADVRYVMTLPWVATASDGSAKVADDSRPHPRSFGTFSRKVGRYSIQEKVLPLAAAVRSASGLPADIIGMNDRGYLKKDRAADIVVFDPKTFEDEATFDEPFKPSTGVRYLLVNGKLAIADGEPKDLHAGKALRRPTPK